MNKSVNFWKTLSKSTINASKFYSMSTTSKCTRIPQKNYYKILGIDAHASNRDIKAAYIKLAKMFHPDTKGSSPEAKKHFQDIAEAYQILSDVRNRKIYDKFGAITKQIQDVGKNISTNDYFKDLLKQKNVIEKTEASLTTIQAIRGGPQTIKLNLEAVCRACEGLRRAKSAQEKCKCCGGSGKTIVQKNVKITTPENLKSGQTVDIPSPLDPTKTLRISFSVNASPEYRQEGHNIHSSIEISLSQALLGDNIPIRGIYADHRLRIPAGIQSHTVLKLPGRGIRKSVSGTETGDHFVTVIVVIPRRLTKTQLEIIRAFAKTENIPKKEL